MFPNVVLARGSTDVFRTGVTVPVKSIAYGQVLADANLRILRKWFARSHREPRVVNKIQT